MRKDLNIKEGDIVLIPPAQVNNSFCRLNQYINLLKYLKVKPPFDFSYIGSGTEMIEGLTIKENIEMMVDNNSLNRGRPFEQLKDKLHAEKRLNLSKLITNIKMVDLYPSKASPSQRKLATIIKALIIPSKFLFIEDIENNLSDIEISLVTASIIEHCEKYNSTLFIKSANSKFWFQHANKLITRTDDLSYSFSTIVKDNLAVVNFGDKTEPEVQELPQEKLSA